MDVIMDGLMIAGAAFAGVYCWVLSGRVRALKSLDSGLGGAIVQLTRQIELARATLEEARAAGKETRQDLAQLTARADAAAAQLRLLMAASERGGAAAFAPAVPAPAQTPAPRSAHVPAAVSAEPPAAAPVTTGDVLAARRRDPGAGPRLVSPAADPEPAPPAAAPQEAAPRRDAPEGDPAGVPKPRRTLSLDGLLRRQHGERAAPASEADVIAALNALASGGER